MNHTLHNFLIRLYEEVARELSARLQEEIWRRGWWWIETASYTLDTSPFIYDPKVLRSANEIKYIRVEARCLGLLISVQI